MLTAYCIPTRLAVLVEFYRVVQFYEVHTLTIQFLNAFPDLSIILVVVEVVEVAAPMTEVTADDK